MFDVVGTSWYDVNKMCTDPDVDIPRGCEDSWLDEIQIMDKSQHARRYVQGMPTDLTPDPMDEYMGELSWFRTKDGSASGNVFLCPQEEGPHRAMEGVAVKVDDQLLEAFYVPVSVSNLQRLHDATPQTFGTVL